jgi:hypothetical protein
MINALFEHYLLTCFNVDRGFDPENIRNSSEYLDSRFSIFESITVPSVAAQSLSSFSWLVFFDINTPIQYKKRFSYITESVNMKPIYVKDYNDIKIALKREIKPETEYLVTTNLDNDDAIAENFIEIIQSNLKEEEVYLMNFLMGYMMSDRGLFMREYFSSPFHTLCEQVSDEPITCFDITHRFLFELQEKGVSLYQIICEPTWLQIIHGSNVRNKIEANAVPIFGLKNLTRFHIQALPFQVGRSSIDPSNRTSAAFAWLKKKKNKPLSLRIKLLFYTLFPQISIIYNQCKQWWQLPRRSKIKKYSIEEFKKLLVDFKERALIKK